MSIFSGIASFFKNFFTNAKADPMSTAKGLVSLAAAGGVCYLGATSGLDPALINTIAAPLVVNGIHAIGTNTTTGQTDPAAGKLIEGVSLVSAAVPSTMAMVGTFAAMKQEAAGKDPSHADTLANIAQVAAALAGVMPQPQAANILNTAQGSPSDVKVQ